MLFMLHPLGQCECNLLGECNSNLFKLQSEGISFKMASVLWYFDVVIDQVRIQGEGPGGPWLPIQQYFL